MSKPKVTQAKVKAKVKAKGKGGSWLGRVVKQGVDGTVEVGKASSIVTKTVVKGTVKGTVGVVNKSKTVINDELEWAKADGGGAKSRRAEAGVS